MRGTKTGAGLAVSEYGDAGVSVPRVVLVHGAMDRAKSFRRVVEKLPDLRIVVYDRRGYGESVEAGPPVSLAQHADDLLEVMGPVPATVVGHSFGCHVAVLAAISQPERFTGLGLWEPQVPWMEFWPPSVKRGLEAMAAQTDTEALAEQVYQSMVGKEAWLQLPEALKAHRRAEGAAFQSDIASELKPPFDWNDLRVPSLLGVGLQTWPFARDAAFRLAEMLGSEPFTIEGAAHTAHLSHPEHFAEFVRRSTTVG
jgi:pimeloyl-ACP methyl ester carboxylesterase